MTRQTWLIARSALILAIALAGCGEDAASEPTSDEAAWDGKGLCDGTVAKLGLLEFHPCTDRATGRSMECAAVDVPLDWCDGESERIVFFLRRIESTVAPKLGSIWLLNGGPGYPGDDLVAPAEIFLRQGLDVYLPDYRGVGQSTDLNCPGTGAMSEQCLSSLHARWGDGLRHFGTNETALDIGHVIHELRAPDEKVFFWANSYGTFLANRYLEFFPSQANGLVFDGACPPSGCDVRMDRNADLVARRVLDHCGSDAGCSGKLSSNPSAWLGELLESVRGGHCSESFGKSTEPVLREVLGLTLSEPRLIPAGLAFAYRLDRCDSDDVQAIRHFAVGPSATAFGQPGSQSFYLFYNVVFSEFWDDALTPEQARLESKDYLLSRGTTEAMAGVRSIWPWPVFKTPSKSRSWAKTDVPLLVLNGTLDSQTTVEGLASFEASYSKPDQNLVIVPWAGHLTLLSASLDVKREDRCVSGIVASFLASPSEPVDTSCFEDLPAPDFGPNQEMARVLFGVEDLWENGSPSLQGWTAPAQDYPKLWELRARAEKLLPWIR